jgi:pSer/pThr/pTyr-binding forkhead associated (FHA) protein
MAMSDEPRPGAGPRRPEDEETQLLRRALSEDAARRLDERVRDQASVEVFDVNGDLLEIVALTPAGLTIGRGPDQDVRLTDRTVSRRHARIEVIDGRYYIDDAGSLNDTLLNGELVRGRAELRDGSRLTVGLHLLIITLR